MSDTPTTAAPAVPDGAVEVHGGWIRMKDPETVPERDHRLIDQEWQDLSIADRRLMRAPDPPKGSAEPKPMDLLSKEGAATLFRMNDIGAVIVIDAWSFAAPITPDGLASLPRKTYQAIQEATSKPVAAMVPDYDDPDGDPTQP